MKILIESQEMSSNLIEQAENFLAKILDSSVELFNVEYESGLSYEANIDAGIIYRQVRPSSAPELYKALHDETIQPRNINVSVEEVEDRNEYEGYSSLRIFNDCTEDAEILKSQLQDTVNAVVDKLFEVRYELEDIFETD